MNDKVFKKLELTGTSAVSIEDAIQKAVASAAENDQQVRWFEVTEIRGAIDKNKVSQWQVSLKIGCVFEE
jgi:flavin-binding protein dodecin